MFLSRYHRMKAEPPLPDPPQSTAAASAVRIDLTAADKTIRRPGSAPDLASHPPTAVGGRTIKGSLKQQRSLDRNEIKRKSRRVVSFDLERDCVNTISRSLFFW